jgi:hypothetical protein
MNTDSTTTITTTNTTISTSTTTIINIIQRAESLAKNINDYTKASMIIIPSVIGAVCSIISLLYYTVKYYKNNCQFKVTH